MNITELVMLIILLIICAEVTYLLLKTPLLTALRRQSRSILLDTSVLIDGRIISVAQSGFIGGTLVIPKSVLGELQFLADTGDHDKRSRARYGLDVVSELQALQKVEVKILQDGSKADEGVDERLINLAKKDGSAICTIDYNLNKVALVEGIAVLNINELAQNLRMAYLPGEKMNLALVQKGQDSHQAVGYLPDGTLVVVEHAHALIGQTIEVEIIRSLQTAAGRMMFARRVAQNAQPVQKNEGRSPAHPRKSLRDEHIAQKSERRPKSGQFTKPRQQNTRSPERQAVQGSRRQSSDIENSLINLIDQS